MEPVETKAPVRIRLRSWLPRAMFESSLIVFSVLLALALNEWRAGAAQRDRVAQAMAAIRSELEENRRLVLDAREYHTTISTGFRAAANAGAEPPEMEGMDRGLAAPALVLRNAWESAQQADLLAHLPYETILKLSTVYARQAEYENLSRTLSQIVYQQAVQDGIDAMLRQYARYIVIQNELANRERTLDAYYTDALEVLPDRTGSFARR
jgi:hypothetical protein